MSDIQIAYVHWGDEYTPVHNTRQEVLARVLIDAGTDAVIGHHPHVIQDIEIYKNAPIFYSLGNFIFDQYFSTEVQEGLLVTLDFAREKSIFGLTVVTSEATPSQPYVAPTTTQSRVLQRILAPYVNDERVDTTRGIITLING